MINCIKTYPFTTFTLGTSSFYPNLQATVLSAWSNRHFVKVLLLFSIKDRTTIMIKSQHRKKCYNMPHNNHERHRNNPHSPCDKAGDAVIFYERKSARGRHRRCTPSRKGNPWHRIKRAKSIGNEIRPQNRRVLPEKDRESEGPGFFADSRHGGCPIGSRLRGCDARRDPQSDGARGAVRRERQAGGSEQERATRIDPFIGAGFCPHPPRRR